MEDERKHWSHELQRLKYDAIRRPKQTMSPLQALLRGLRAALAQAPDDTELLHLEACARFSEATIYAQSGKMQIAERAFITLLHDVELREDHELFTDCLGALSVVEARMGNQKQALRRLERCSYVLNQRNAPADQRAQTLMNIGIIQAQLGEHPSALETLQFAQELFGDDNDVSAGIIKCNQALIYRTLGDEARSIDLLDESLRRLEASAPSVAFINVLLERAIGDLRHGALPAAGVRLERAREMMSDIGSTILDPEYRLVAARLYLACGEPVQAEAELAAGMLQANPEQRTRLLMLRVEAAEANEDWQGALHWQRICHEEQMAVTKSHHQIQLAGFQERLATTIVQERTRWLQGALQRAQAEVHTLSNRLREQTSIQAAAAHDINNPLSVVLLLAELAASEPESLHESADAIVEAAKHMRSLVSQLIGSSPQHSSAPVLSICPLLLNTLLETACVRYRPLASAKDQNLTLSQPDLYTIEGDQSAVERVIDNLLSNAIKYTPAGGTITLYTHQKGERVCIEVLDTGPGLSPADLERVFLYSQRLSAVPTHGEAQHGLGLVNVRRLVMAMGGRVYAENRLRCGARFVVELLLSA